MRRREPVLSPAASAALSDENARMRARHLYHRAKTLHGLDVEWWPLEDLPGHVQLDAMVDVFDRAGLPVPQGGPSREVPRASP